MSAQAIKPQLTFWAKQTAKQKQQQFPRTSKYNPLIHPYTYRITCTHTNQSPGPLPFPFPQPYNKPLHSICFITVSSLLRASIFLNTRSRYFTTSNSWDIAPSSGVVSCRRGSAVGEGRIGQLNWQSFASLSHLLWLSWVSKYRHQFSQKNLRGWGGWAGLGCWG